jgi:hypothetical protein
MLSDAVCSFNPTYGQGMDRVPTLDARFVRATYKRVARAITPAWQMMAAAFRGSRKVARQAVPSTARERQPVRA